jgi:glycosyltransferase involved in cell wall biosynthesis
MRVVMLTQSYLPLPGGAERQIASLAPLLAQRGIQVTVITRRTRADLPARERMGAVDVFRLPVPGPKAAASLAYTLGALPLILRLHPDVIHAHELLSPTTTALAARRLSGRPVVAKILRGGALGDIDKLRHRRGGLGRLRAICRVVERFLVISQEIDRELADLGVAAERRVFLPNGVDCARFTPARPGEKAALRAGLGLPVDGPLAIYNGRLSTEKRIDRLLNLWPGVRGEVPGAGLVVVGSGPEAARLRGMAGEGVIFTDQVEDVAPYLRAADVFVLPSRTEGLSNALLEGMACGLGVVSSAVGGAVDVIQDGVEGFLPAPEDFDGFRIAMTRLLRDTDLRERMGRAARTRVEAGYSLTATADGLAAVYRSLARRGG